MSRLFLSVSALVALWFSSALCMSVFSSSPQAHMLLRSRRANSFLEEIKQPSLERECVEEVCNLEEAREIFQTTEATMEFWTKYSDGNQCNPNPCANGTCVDQYQSFTCLCNLGYEGKHCEYRVTATSCEADNGDCDHECENWKDGKGRTCSCTEGYELHENSKKCVPKGAGSCGQILLIKSSYKSKPTEGLQPWVIGGEVGKKGESPWQALVLNASGRFHCGGVLIDKNWVLTAAHCLETSVHFGVRLGDYERFKMEGTEVTLRVTRAIPHPKYNPSTVDNDIALLELESPVPFSKDILPACLPSQSLAERVLHREGTLTVVTGWGKDNVTARHYSSALNFIEIPLVSTSECEKHMANNLTNNVLCGGILGQMKDACEGDSGGPMMTLFHDTWFLIGLVSWGEGCGNTNKLGIYTKVSNYMDWIDSVRKGSDKA
ncbi:vitamin K-dependent protein C [Chanos chanos]|uniref:Vitamin K-dependent protein C n=1 Tax=Chanos chanos TaxID=29144 RepID=A0A6J2VFV6_CHACN|nr:vitamin K-dependent protein C [Chanos chanos]